MKVAIGTVDRRVQRTRSLRFAQRGRHVPHMVVHGCGGPPEDPRLALPGRQMAVNAKLRTVCEGLLIGLAVVGGESVLLLSALLSA